MCAPQPCHGSAAVLSQAPSLIEQGAARIPPRRVRSGATAGAGGASPAGAGSSAVRGGRDYHVGQHPASRGGHHDSLRRSRCRRVIVRTRWHVPSAAPVAGWAVRIARRADCLRARLSCGRVERSRLPGTARRSVDAGVARRGCRRTRIRSACDVVDRREVVDADSAGRRRGSWAIGQRVNWQKSPRRPAVPGARPAGRQRGPGRCG
jgi:hypothetical protein